MRVVIQRVSSAAVVTDGTEIARIGPGMLVLLGIAAGDSEEDVEWLAGKIARLRIFADPAGAMNRSIADAGGDILLVSQFTLHASTRKGNRPSFIAAARPEEAIPLYRRFAARLEQETGKRIPTGRFGADMQVSLINDGPVTVIIDSRSRE